MDHRDGNSKRGHRKNISTPDLFISIALGERLLRCSVVSTFAEVFTEKTGSDESSPARLSSLQEQF